MADLFPGVIFPSTSRVQWKSTMTFPFLKGVACSTCSFLTDAADAAGAAGASADAAGAAGAPDAAAGAADASADAAGATGAADAAGAAGAACPFSKGSCPPVVVPFSKGASSFAFSSGILHSPFFHCSFHARQVLLLPFSSTPSSPLAPCSWRTMPWRHHSPCCPWSCWSCSCSFPFPLVWEVLVAFSFCHLPAPPPPHPRHPSPSTHHLFPKSLPIHLFPKSFSSFSTNLFPKSNHFPMSHLPKSHLFPKSFLQAGVAAGAAFGASFWWKWSPCQLFLPALFLPSPFARCFLFIFHIQLGELVVNVFWGHQSPSPSPKGLSSPWGTGVPKVVLGERIGETNLRKLLEQKGCSSGKSCSSNHSPNMSTWNT